MSEFYDKVKKLHDEKMKKAIGSYYDDAYALIEKRLGVEGKDSCCIEEYDSDDEEVTNKLIDMLIDDGFSATYDYGSSCIIVRFKKK
jgi:hypothetical protein